jgi:trehalose 2-sulfotransferase
MGHQDVWRSCILCTVPRSGSWLLADLLDQTGLVGHPEEYFRWDFRNSWSSEWGIRPSGPYGPYVRAALEHTSTDNGVFGVKLHWYQLTWLLEQLKAAPLSPAGLPDHALLAHWLPGPSYVHLHRDDTVRQAISYYKAAHTDVWFELQEDDPDAANHGPLAPSPMPDEPDWANVRYLENIVIDHERRWREWFARGGIEPLEVRYEDLVADYGGTVGRILDFMGVERPADLELPEPRLKKQGDDKTERWVESYLQVRDTIEPRRLDLKPVRMRSQNSQPVED